MVDVTTDAQSAQGPTQPIATEGVRTRRSPQKPQTPAPLSTRSSTASANGANGSHPAFDIHAKPSSHSQSRRSSQNNVSPQRSKSESSRRRKPLFVSCVTFPESGPVLAPVVVEGGEPQRSQRRSKVEALNKIDRGGTPSTLAAGPAATSFVPPPPPPAGPSVVRNPLKRPRILNPPFDLNSVRTKPPADASPSNQPRAFGLEHCPIYHPTTEQFRDPMAYIDSIAAEAKAYGMCKIVPPEGWQMPFDMDPETFRFTTRLQRLNSIEATSRAKINFLEQLSMFHKQQGDAHAHIPIVDHRLLDVWRLRKEVNKLGGIDEVNRLKAWPAITELLGYNATSMPQIRSAYTKLILPFETWALRAKSYPESPLTPIPSVSGKVVVGSGPPGTPDTPMGAKQGRMSSMRTSPRGRMSTGSAGASALAAVANENPAGPSNASGSESGLAAPIRIKVSGFQTSSHGSDSELSEEESSRSASQSSSSPEQTAYKKGDVCEICSLGNNAAKILLCDGCDRGFHTFCLDPPLKEIPTNEWYCTACLLGNGDDFGFDEGEEHSLASFQARDQAFAAAWFNHYAHRPLLPTEPGPTTRVLDNALVSEADVEREFWRLVESQEDTVEVEYGADVHSTTHGSAAPTVETRPTSQYARDPWNLNNMAIVRDSILRYIKSDISGMTVPWIYVGMLFSAFCWHNEDHYTYSVNYMFWGETKTWYGIPGSGAELFEDAMRREAPELFERQPSLLYQLVTIMNPGRLKDQGVPVYACDQRPNEFVITFPKAYHCGFNHGLNFNEAVNFALPDWLPLGKESVDRYKEHAKQPVFSHEELLITITLYSDSIKTALWLQHNLWEVVVEENARRDQVRKAIPDIVEILDEEDVPEERYQCYVCKAFCYLAQMTCSCTHLVTCLNHHELLCNCPQENRSMRKRYSDKQLEDILEAVVARATQPEQWGKRLDTTLKVARPQLKAIRQLVADGERIPYDLPGLEDLRTFLARANAWVDRATAVCTRKSTGRRRKGRQSEVAMDDDDIDRSAEALRALIAESDRLGFDSPEILQLRQMISDMEDFRRDAQILLSLPADSLDYEQCKTTLILGQSLNVELPEVAALGKIVARLQWYHKVEEEVDDRTLQYDDILNLLEEARATGIPEDYEGVILLREREQKGRQWKEAVDQVLASDNITLDSLSALIEDQDLVPTSVEAMRNLENIRKTAQSWQATAQNILASRGTAASAARLCKAVRSASGALSRVDIPEVAQLQAELDFNDTWCHGVAGILAVNANKVQTSVTSLLREIEEHLQENDADPNPEHACFCRAAPAATMVTCPLCSGEYHPKCVGISAKTASGIKTASANFKCQMCQNLQYDDRPSLSELTPFIDPVKWNFVLPPPGYEQLQQCIEHAARFAFEVVKLFDPDFAPASARPKPASWHQYIGHHLRKIWTLPVQLSAIRTVVDPQTSEETHEELFFEQWLYSRLRGLTDRESKVRTRARKPKFSFDKAHPHVFSCICSTPPLDHLLTVQCYKCEQGFHMSCVQAPIAAVNRASTVKYRCPFCVIKGGKPPAGLDLRVQLPEKVGTQEYVDWRRTIFTYAEAPIPITLPDSRECVILEMSKFTPPAVPEGFERPVWVEDEEKRKKRKADSLVSTPSRPESTIPVAMPPASAGPSHLPAPSSSAPLPLNQPANNVRTNGRLFYPTHSIVPWEDTSMFSQFQVRDAREPGNVRANGSSNVNGGPAQFGTPLPPPAQFAGAPVAPRYVEATRVPPRPAPPVTTTATALGTTSTAPVVTQAPKPVPAPSPSPALPQVHAQTHAPPTFSAPALETMLNDPVPSVPSKRSLSIDESSLPPMKRHSPVPPSQAV